MGGESNSGGRRQSSVGILIKLFFSSGMRYFCTQNANVYILGLRASTLTSINKSTYGKCCTFSYMP